MSKANEYIFLLTSIIILGFVCFGLYYRGFFNFNKQPQVVGSVQYTEPTPVVVTVTPEANQPITFIFAGDMMFDRHIRKHAQTKNGYDFVLNDVTQMFNQADMVVANLEGPVTDYPSKSLGSAVGSTNNFLFTFDPKIISSLEKNNIKMVNLGNNHILNFGLDGLAQTYSYLDASKIKYFGNAGQGDLTPQRYVITEINGIKFGFVNYNQFVVDGLPAALTDLQAAQASADFIIVYTHWGNEYVQENQVLKDLAHQFIDAGADAVIGSHPHVIQGKEVYNGKQIYYSLGNFVFDQYFEPGVREGLLVKMTINPADLTQEFLEYKVSLNQDGTTTFQTESATPAATLQ